MFKLANKMIFEFFVENFFVSHKFYVFIVKFNPGSWDTGEWQSLNK
jgi:hypothetical protein